MENLFQLRLETKRLLRDNKPSQKEYEEALPLCKNLWEAFSETNNLWDAQQYANVNLSLFYLLVYNVDSV